MQGEDYQALKGQFQFMMNYVSEYLQQNKKLKPQRYVQPEGVSKEKEK